jgi:hypothetical protein
VGEREIKHPVQLVAGMKRYPVEVELRGIMGEAVDLKESQEGMRNIEIHYAPRSVFNSGLLSKSHDHAHTVKNRSSCSSNASCPREYKIEVKEPCVSLNCSYPRNKCSRIA